MAESKKGIHLIDLNNYLFFNSPDIYYSLSFEIVETNKIKVILIKILETETYIFENIVPFSDFGTEDSSPLESLKTVSILIYNYKFIIKEELNKAFLYINTKKPASIELFLHELKKPEDIDIYYEEQMKIMQNKISELVNKISMQEQKMNQIQKNEENNINKIKNMEQVAKNLSLRLDSKNNNNNQINNNKKQYTSNQYSNIKNQNNANYNPYNPYKTNTNNNTYSTNNSNNIYNNNSNNPYNTNNSNKSYNINNSNNSYSSNNPYDVNNNAYYSSNQIYAQGVPKNYNMLNNNNINTYNNAYNQYPKKK